MTRILIAGIGGVGGYIGGLLAKTFSSSNEVEIFFLARGEHLNKIRESGLTLIGPHETLVCRPKEASDRVASFKVMDYVILCTKSYSLQAVLSKLRPVVSHDTVVLPLQNGVENTDVVKNIFPDATVLNGCAHMVSRYISPGAVQFFGQRPRIIFGPANTDAIVNLRDILLHSGIDVLLTENAATMVWEKFVFISALATATVYYDRPVGAIRDDSDGIAMLTQLLNESLQIAKAHQIDFPIDFQKTLLTRIESIPYDSTTSMHTDFINHTKSTELETLTGYIVNEGMKKNIPTPAYLKIYQILKARIGG